MDEEPSFLWVGNHPATDLCNTEPVIAGERVELLADLEAVVAWARQAGVARVGDLGGISDGERARTLAFVHELRRALRSVLEPPSPDPESVGALNAVLAREAGVLRVDPGAAESVSLAGGGAGAQLRLDIAAATIDVVRHDRHRIRRCANPGCVLLFLDLSRSGRRRWCDMATCGNRAKAAAHYARARRVAQGGGPTKVES